VLPQEIIRKKRDGARLSAEELRAVVHGITRGALGDAQVAAFAMAVFFRGMEDEECREFTLAMRDSGERLDWSRAGFDGPIVDKHSTGGVGDKVSLILAPLLAACGAIVPMIAGRGLGHTGGTIDKLEAIPGVTTLQSPEKLRHILRSAGCAIVSQSQALAPADRRLYAIRDVTATVESVPLITASILSKKLAAGLQHLLIDLKVGSGAFARDLEVGRLLARSLVRVATQAGLPSQAMLTDMNQVLGTSAGNAVEVLEALEVLRGRNREPRLTALTLELASELLTASGLAETHEDAMQRARRVLDEGHALERFAEMIHAMGGPPDIADDPDPLPLAPSRIPVIPARAGYVRAIDTRRIGLTITALGGGRRMPGERIDPGVGLAGMRGIGTRVGPGEPPLCWIFARLEESAHAAQLAILDAVELSEDPVATPPLILDRVRMDDP